MFCAGRAEEYLLLAVYRPQLQQIHREVDVLCGQLPQGKSVRTLLYTAVGAIQIMYK